MLEQGQQPSESYVTVNVNGVSVYQQVGTMVVKDELSPQIKEILRQRLPTPDTKDSQFQARVSIHQGGITLFDKALNGSEMP